MLTGPEASSPGWADRFAVLGTVLFLGVGTAWALQVLGQDGHGPLDAVGVGLLIGTPGLFGIVGRIVRRPMIVAVGGVVGLFELLLSPFALPLIVPSVMLIVGGRAFATQMRGRDVVGVVLPVLLTVAAAVAALALTESRCSAIEGGVSCTDGAWSVAGTGAQLGLLLLALWTAAHFTTPSDGPQVDRR